MSKYETVIGLEVHVQLATKTKVFCSCSTAFGAPPNTQVCPVCLGLPGVLPVLNKKAFEYAIKVAIALDCGVQKVVKFDRKNYYYPDLPKNYQISQFDMPIAYKGHIDLYADTESPRRIGITRAHLEEDAGKLIHDERAPYSYVDLNRTGTPLLEIVSEPDIRTPQEAYDYLTVLKQTIKYLEVSDCNMEEGSLRCDANISLRRKGEEKLGTKVEIKNLNSFKAVKEALLYEEERQEDLLDEGGKIVQETRLWDEVKSVTISMRSKEESHDYRYFPEPDLVPFEVKKETVDRIRAEVPELPAEKAKRFASEYKLDKKDVEVLIAEKDIAEFFEATAEEAKDARSASNWVKGEVMKHLNERGTGMKGLGLKAEHLARIIELAKAGTISGLAAKEVLAACIDTGKDPASIVKEKGMEQVSDEGELESVVDKVIAENEKPVNDFKGGKEASLGFLIGQVMRQSKGKANPKIAGDMLKKRILGQ